MKAITCSTYHGETAQPCAALYRPFTISQDLFMIFIETAVQKKRLQKEKTKEPVGYLYE